MQKMIVFLCMLCSMANISFGQVQTPVYLSSSIPNGNSKGFYSCVPSDYATSGKKYPLMIWAHGAGQVGQGNVADLPKVLQYGVPKIISEGGFPASFTVGDSSFSFIVISPQFISTPSPANMAAILSYALSNYRVDTDRVYMVGISLGGGAVWNYASASKANSNTLAAIIPFCGTAFPTQALANVIASANLPVWAFHNTNDGTVPVSYSRNWVNYINNYTPRVNPAAMLTEFPVISNDPVIAHECWSLATLPSYKPNGINIYEWLLKYRKRSASAVNIPPLANAGSDASVVLPSNLTLNGSGSSDSDGSITSYRWKKISGPSAYQFIDSTVVNPVIQNLTAGIYGFELTVTDNANATAKDTVLINVTAAVPAGSERRVLIDAGPPAANGGVLTPSPTNGYYWNNMTDARAGVQLSAAKTTTNLTTAIGIQVVNRIDGTYNVSSNGMNNVNSSPAVGIYPTSATNDYAFAHSSTTAGQWKITGLEADKLYTIKFWGTKSGETRDRDIEIKRTDETEWKTYSAASNTNFDNAAFFNVTGLTSVDFNIRAKAGSTFGYINVIDITWNATSTPTPNQPPVAKAGADQNITLPVDSATLAGCTSTDPENAPLKYKWRKIAGGAGFIVNDTLCSAKVKGLTVGNYSFELMVTDTGSLSHKDTVSLTVATPISLAWPVLPAPICPAPYKLVVLGSSTAFGTGATPIDSSWVSKTRLYIQQQNPANTIINIALGGYTTYQINPTGFVPAVAGRPLPDTLRNITAALAQHPDGIIINMPANDAASAFPLQETIDNFNRVAALADSAKVALWVTTSQPRSDLGAAQLTSLMQLRDWINQRFAAKAIDFWTDIANADGTINPTFGAGDNVHLNNYGHHILFTRVLNEKIWDTICLRNLPPNLAPVARAGNDTSIVGTGIAITLHGNGSYDPEGQALTYSWKVINNAAGIITNAATVNPTFTAGAKGIYSIELSVKDPSDLEGKDTVKVFVSVPNVLPVANAGANILIQAPTDTTTLKGNLSYDPDGVITQYKWRKIQGPAATILNDALANTRISGLIAGNYSFELAVTDDSAAIAKDTVAIVLNAQPVARAGADQFITLPANTATLSAATSSDTDGSITAYQWRKVTGANATIASASTAQTLITFTTAGQYTFEVVITDNNGGTGKDTIAVTVNPDPNVPPVARAGADASIQLPVSKILLDGRTSTDANGPIASFQWTFVSGPSGSQLLTPAKDTTSVSFVNAGVYVYRLTVTDSGGLTSTDDVQITVVAVPVTTKALRINLYDGTVPYVNAQWNNWSPASNVNSTTFKYEDGTQSSIFVNLSDHPRFSDNGLNYAPTSTVCPPAVLRFNSIATFARTFTVSGLVPAQKYNFEFYASRSVTSGSKSIYRTGNVADTIDTDNNARDYAKFINISADNNGRVIFNLTYTGTYNYLAGFSIIEQAAATTFSFGRSAIAADTAKQASILTAEDKANKLIIYPNPFADKISVKINDKKAGQFLIYITDMAGDIKWKRSSNKTAAAFVETIQTANLKPGIYFMHVITSGEKNMYKLIRR